MYRKREMEKAGMAPINAGNCTLVDGCRAVHREVAGSIPVVIVRGDYEEDV